MPDYYTPVQLAVKLGLSEEQIAELESKGLIHPKLKDGRRFFPSHQAHALQVALRMAHRQKVTLERAFERIEEFRRRQASTTAS